MKTVCKGMAWPLAAAILFFLFLTPRAAAEEGPPGAGGAFAVPSAVAAPAEETPAPAAPSAADTAATAEELLEWLAGHQDTGGTVCLSADISLCDVSYVHPLRKPAITVDTGGFSLTANGSVELLAGSPFTIRGVGGKNGLLRVSEKSALYLDGLTLEAQQGYAAFQEEGSGFMAENTSFSGDVHYAEQPFIWDWKPGLAVVALGEAFDPGRLPAGLLARVNSQGRTAGEYVEVPVAWDRSGAGEAQTLRRRFAVSGEFENMASQKAPCCTVAFNDFPLTFLEVSARKTQGRFGDAYRFTGGFSKPEGRLPITVAQEYSFDGVDWVACPETTATAPNSGFSISPFVAADDLERVSDIFIRLHWEDAGTVYYSNVLRFAADSLLANEEPGGNRGGGTDLVDPPKPPKPDPAPETDPPKAAPAPAPSQPAPGQPANGAPGREVGGGGEGAASPPAASGGGGGPSHGVTQNREPPGGSPEPEAAPSRGESAEDLPQPTAAPAVPGPRALPAAAFLAAVAACIGGAALCLRPKAWKALLSKLRGRIGR